MKIREILNRNRNDFTATMECEYCGRAAKLTSGYDDDFYRRSNRRAACGTSG